MQIDEIIPIEGSSKPDQVTKALEKIILSKKISPGEKLPSQQELAAKFNIGIRSIREALKHLEAKGLIDIRHGKGIFVKANNLDFYMESLTDSLSFNYPCTREMLLALTQVRSIIETAIVRDISIKVDVDTLNQLDEIAHRMELLKESSSSNMESQKLDMLFHMAIVQASGNQILIALYKRLSGLLFASIINSDNILPNAEKAFNEHKELLKAIKDHGTEQAVEVITKHLSNTRYLLETIAPDADPLNGCVESPEQAWLPDK
jgi:GntR family transcriptional repressor for pyruvate dehydrogenase complex